MSGLRSVFVSTPANGAKFLKNSARALSSRRAFRSFYIPSGVSWAAKTIRSHSRNLSCWVEPFAIQSAILSNPVCQQSGTRSILSAIKWNIFSRPAFAGLGS